MRRHPVREPLPEDQPDQVDQIVRLDDHRAQRQQHGKRGLQTAHAGSYKAAVRMFPKNDKLPHRQDFAYVKWLEY